MFNRRLFCPQREDLSTPSALPHPLRIRSPSTGPVATLGNVQLLLRVSEERTTAYGCYQRVCMGRHLSITFAAPPLRNRIPVASSFISRPSISLVNVFLLGRRPSSALHMLLTPCGSLVISPTGPRSQASSPEPTVHARARPGQHLIFPQL